MWVEFDLGDSRQADKGVSLLTSSYRFNFRVVRESVHGKDGKMVIDCRCYSAGWRSEFRALVSRVY